MYRSLQVTGVHMDITDALRTYVEQRMTALEKFISPEDDRVRISVELSKTTEHHKHAPDGYRTEIQVVCAEESYFAGVSTDDLYGAIDEAVDDLIRQVRDTRGRVRHLLRSGGMRLKKLLRLER